MPAYAIAHLRPTQQLAPEPLEYMRKVQATLDPFGGHFLVHGAGVDVLEGTWPGSVVMIEFPSLTKAGQWYESPAYQRILPLRADYIDGDVVLVDGVGANHDSAALADQFAASPQSHHVS